MLLVVFRGHTRQHKQACVEAFEGQFQGFLKGDDVSEVDKCFTAFVKQGKRIFLSVKVGERGYNAFLTKSKGEKKVRQ